MTDKKSSYEYTKHFCESVDQNPGDALEGDIWVQEAELRASLIFEELVELLASLGVSDYLLGLLEQTFDTSEINQRGLNRKELVDALGDLDVVVNNAAIFFSVDMETVSKRVFDSNMSKLCDTEEEADLSILAYKDKGIQVSKKRNKFGKWYIYNTKTGKILKGINFKEPDLNNL